MQSLCILLYSIGSNGVHEFMHVFTSEELVSAYVHTCITLRNRSARASATGKVGKMWLGTAVDCLWSYSCRPST